MALSMNATALSVSVVGQSMNGKAKSISTHGLGADVVFSIAQWVLWYMKQCRAVNFGLWDVNHGEKFRKSN